MRALSAIWHESYAIEKRVVVAMVPRLDDRGVAFAHGLKRMRQIEIVHR